MVKRKECLWHLTGCRGVLDPVFRHKEFQSPGFLVVSTNGLKVETKYLGLIFRTLKFVCGVHISIKNSLGLHVYPSYLLRVDPQKDCLRFCRVTFTESQNRLWTFWDRDEDNLEALFYTYHEVRWVCSSTLIQITIPFHLRVTLVC